MGEEFEVFVDLAFQGRMSRADEFLVAELMVFVSMLAEFGLDANSVPGYSVVTETRRNAAGHIAWQNILLKMRGAWTALCVEVRQPGVLVVFDRIRR